MNFNHFLLLFFLHVNYVKLHTCHYMRNFSLLFGGMQLHVEIRAKQFTGHNYFFMYHGTGTEQLNSNKELEILFYLILKTISQIIFSKSNHFDFF